MQQEAAIADCPGFQLSVPGFMDEIIAQITHEARQSPDINQRSGVSVRASIANYEALAANALRRALRLGESLVVPRISDLPFVVPSFQGKVEFEAMEDGQEDKIVDRIMRRALQTVFDRHYDVNDLESIALSFNDGLNIDVGESLPGSAYDEILEKIPSLRDVFPDANSLSSSARAATIEFILEGLHLHKLLNKYSLDGQTTFTG